jgi:hypothetical protein
MRSSYSEVNRSSTLGYQLVREIVTDSIREATLAKTNMRYSSIMLGELTLPLLQYQSLPPLAVSDSPQRLPRNRVFP